MAGSAPAPVLTSTAGSVAGTPAAAGLISAAQALDDLGNAGTRLSVAGAYQFRISLSGSLARGGPVRGERLVVSGTVIPGIGRLVRFDASGPGAEPSVTYLERGSRAWLLLPTRRWLSVVPVEGDQPGTFTDYFPAAFYETYDWPWINGATLLPRRTASATTATRTPSSPDTAVVTRSYVVDPAALSERATAAGFNAPVRWKMRVAVAPVTGALMAVDFSGQTTEAKGRTNAFAESLVITPIRRAALPKPG